MEIRPTHDVQQNIFGFDDPDNIGCLIQEYHNSHKVLIVNAYARSGRPPIRISFSMVYYLAFSGPMGWKGANFELLPIEESLRMASTLDLVAPHLKVEPSSEVFQHMIASICKVFRVHPQDRFSNEIIICAAGAHIESE